MNIVTVVVHSLTTNTLREMLTCHPVWWCFGQPSAGMHADATKTSIHHIFGTTENPDMH
jgi:hypothetical protein